MTQLVDESLVSRRTPMLLAALFGGIALFLAAIGIYGVLAYQVAQRRKEIGIRLALGSDGRRIFGLIVSEGLWLLGAGVAIGLAGAFAIRKAMETQLYGVQPMDPLVLAAVAGVLGIVAFAACALPARRAAAASTRSSRSTTTNSLRGPSNGVPGRGWRPDLYPNWWRISEALAARGVTVSPEALSKADPIARRELDDRKVVGGTTDASRGWLFFDLILSHAGVQSSEATRAALVDLHAYHAASNLWEVRSCPTLYRLSKRCAPGA